jgi:signal peptidase I
VLTHHSRKHYNTNVVLKIIRLAADFIIEIFETAALAVLIFLILYVFVMRPHQVFGSSMLPTLKDGDHILTEVATTKFLGREPKRGDIIVFRAPKQPNLDFIKRIIGLPGEKVKIQNGNVFIINKERPEGFLLKEDYLDGAITDPHDTAASEETLDTGDGYFVMGDNRERSSDSRDWGIVKKEEIVGRAWVRYWPPTSAEIIKTPSYQ